MSRSVQEQDKRCKLVHLTPKGKKTAEKAMASVLTVANAWLGKALTRRKLEELKNIF